MSTLQLQSLQTHHLQPVSLTVGDGECVCLSGPSGSGKSLLLRAIADLDPHGGQVLLDGVACTEVQAPKWRREVALLPADSPWWLPRVGDHFCAAAPHGIAELGFDSAVLEWEVERLSSGERQRLALLRLLCNSPKVLLLDEPTANLDPTSSRQVEDLVTSYRQRTGAAVLWVSHDPEQIKRVASRRMQMRNGALEQAA